MRSYYFADQRKIDNYFPQSVIAEIPEDDLPALPGKISHPFIIDALFYANGTTLVELDLKSYKADFDSVYSEEYEISRLAPDFFHILQRMYVEKISTSMGDPKYMNHDIQTLTPKKDHFYNLKLSYCKSIDRRISLVDQKRIHSERLFIENMIRDWCRFAPWSKNLGDLPELEWYTEDNT